MTLATIRRPAVTLACVALLAGLVLAVLAGRITAPAIALLAVGTVTSASLLVGARDAAPNMDAASVPRLRRSRVRLGATAGCAAMVCGLIVVLAAPGASVAGLELIVAGALASAVIVAPGVVERMRALALVRGALAAVAIAAVIVALVVFHVGAGIVPGGLGTLVGLLVVMIGGALLLADGLGIARFPARQVAQWSLITGQDREPVKSPRRAIAGAVLVIWAIGVGIALAESAVSDHPLAGTLTAIGVLLAAGVAVATPLTITTVLRRQREAAERTREAERQRIAAHLHDSVLQTLALVQRQSREPAVVLIARRQETSLRAWMAGETELASDSLSAELRGVVNEVEDAAEVSIELSMLGDRPAESRDAALIGATREALRNAVQHARGSPTTVYAEVGSGSVEVFVSDDGPGFVLDDVPDSRRGIRDSIQARMAAAGGSAEFTTELGHGTEVLLRLPAA